MNVIETKEFVWLDLVYLGHNHSDYRRWQTAWLEQTVDLLDDPLAAVPSKLSLHADHEADLPFKRALPPVPFGLPVSLITCCVKHHAVEGLYCRLSMGSALQSPGSQSCHEQRGDSQGATDTQVGVLEAAWYWELLTLHWQGAIGYSVSHELRPTIR